MKKLYIGNLPFTATEDELRQLFGQHGTVHSVALINDRETGRPRGFGFIEMDDDAISGVIQALDGKELGGRALRVNQAEDKPRGGGGGGGGGLCTRPDFGVHAGSTCRRGVQLMNRYS